MIFLFVEILKDLVRCSDFYLWVPEPWGQFQVKMVANYVGMTAKDLSQT